MTNGTPTTEQEPQAGDQRDVLGGMNMEANDRLEHATEIAAITAEIRALTGQNLPTVGITRNFNPFGMAGPGNFPLVRGSRLDVVTGGLTPWGAEQLLPRIIENLYEETRLPRVRDIQRAVRSRFLEILAERHVQGGESTDQVHESVIVGRALLDAVYEQIKESDLEEIAANIASLIPGIPVPPDNNLNYSRREYYVLNGRLTPNGLDLLERLRKGGTNPNKVILAFSAALDADYVDTQDAFPATVPALPATAHGKPRINLRTDILGLPAVQLSAPVIRYLERIAEAYEAYASIPNEQLAYDEPPAVGGPRSDTAEAERQRTMKAYGNAVSYSRAVRNALLNLYQYFHTATGTAATTPEIPEMLRPVFSIHQTNFNTYLDTICPANAYINAPGSGRPSLPRASQIRDILATSLGGTLRKSSDYKQDADTPDRDRGRTGTEACDHMLSEYIRRVANVDDNKAKEALSVLTGRVVASKQLLREQRAEMATVRPDREYEVTQQTGAFNKAHRWTKEFYSEMPAGYALTHPSLARIPLIGRIPYVGFWARAPLPYIRRRTALQEFRRELDLPGSIGLAPGSTPMSPANSLETITTRYYTLWYLSRILPKTDEKHLPLTPELASELTRLRRAIVERQVRNISLTFQKQGIDRLRREDVERLGLTGAHIENLPLEEIQERLFAMLNENALNEATMTKVRQKIDTAWAPLQARKEYRTQRAAGWKRRGGWLLGNGALYNPVTWPGKTVRGTYGIAQAGVKKVGGGLGKLWTHLMADGGPMIKLPFISGKQ